MSKLIIVESPTKGKTISKFLSKDFKVIATMGHIRDLPKSKFGVEIKEKKSGFEFIPTYTTDKKKSKTIKELKSAIKKASIVFLATDPDREGEAIAWHVTQMQAGKYKKIHFNQITKPAIEKALKEPGEIDINLVNAQQARRVLDRLVGYSLSPLLWKKIRRGLSAGRVQSVTVRIIVEREREIEKFKTTPFFKIWARFEKNKKEILAELKKANGKSIEKREKIKLFAGMHNFSKTFFVKAKNVEDIIKQLDKDFVVKDVKKKEIRRYPSPPFTTSTLQQEASRRFGWSSRQTMRLAQSLFEKGRITYHRTDSTSLAQIAIDQIRKLVEKDFGKQYLPEKAIFYKTKSKLAQEAHEAIRPTNMAMQEIEADPREKKLYKLIRQKAIACQMNPAKIAQTKIEIENNNFLFRANGSQIIFDGFSKIYPTKFSENDLPEVKVGEKFSTDILGATNHKTSPPPRYNEASLIATLEKNGIGRPSTYAPTIFTIQSRQYVEKEDRKFKPTPVGMTTNDFLVEHFSEIVNLPFTAGIEDSLDDIANGDKKWQPIISDFWGPFIKKTKKVEEKAKRAKIPTEKIGKKCPKCIKKGLPADKQGELVIRSGRFGKFISCDQFPDCDYKESFKEVVDFKCPTCKADVVIKRTRKGAKFFSCSTWPKCDWSSWKKPK